MTNRDRTIAQLKAADITQDDWYWDILRSNTDLFARGYLSRYKEELDGGDIPSHDEEYRGKLIWACGWDIWGQT